MSGVSVSRDSGWGVSLSILEEGTAPALQETQISEGVGMRLGCGCQGRLVLGEKSLPSM